MAERDSDDIAIAKSEFRKIIWILAAFAFVVNILLLTLPLYMLQVYDRVLSSSSMETLVFLSLFAALSLAVMGAIEAVRSIIAQRAVGRLNAHLGGPALVASIGGKERGRESLSPLRDLSSVSSLVASRAFFALMDLPFAPLFVCLLFFINPSLFVLVTVGAAVLAGLAILNQIQSSRHTGRVGKHTQNAMRKADHFAQCRDTVQAMGMWSDCTENWGREHASALASQDRISLFNALISGSSKALRAALQMAVLGWGAVLVLDGQMSAGMIFAASIIAGRGLQPIDQVIGNWRQYVSAYTAWQRLGDEVSSLRAQPTFPGFPHDDGRVSVEDCVVFAGKRSIDNAILKKVSFELAGGECLAIVGPSGAGKSSLARALIGASDIDAGSIRLNGVDIARWDDQSRSQKLGFLSQDVDLMPGTIADNIARMKGGFDRKEVIRAARVAQAETLIQRFTDGYDTVIGAGGKVLSGGEKQRIALARAFFGDPEIVVLDEPNANLDVDGEAALHLAMKDAKSRGATVILITQRQQALAHVDKVLLMSDGFVSYFGSRDDFATRLKLKSMRQKQKAAHEAAVSEEKNAKHALDRGAA
ncbi:MAG: type I secretion system permease/ATPase [Pseudomonadota bacterium]